MRYADLLARITGLCVAVAGAALVGVELFIEVSGTLTVPAVDVVAPGTLTTLGIGTVAVGVAFVIAGLAVLVGRGRAVAVSVGGATVVVAIASLAGGVGPSAGILSVGAVALVLLFAGASTGGHAAG